MIQRQLGRREGEFKVKNPRNVFLGNVLEI